MFSVGWRAGGAGRADGRYGGGPGEVERVVEASRRDKVGGASSSGEGIEVKGVRAVRPARGDALGLAWVYIDVESESIV